MPEQEASYGISIYSNSLPLSGKSCKQLNLFAHDLSGDTQLRSCQI